MVRQKRLLQVHVKDKEATRLERSAYAFESFPQVVLTLQMIQRIERGKSSSVFSTSGVEEPHVLYLPIHSGPIECGPIPPRNGNQFCRTINGRHGIAAPDQFARDMSRSAAHVQDLSCRRYFGKKQTVERWQSR